MKPDPIFSGEAVKAIALFLVALVVGGAGIAVATGSLNISLPDIDLPDASDSSEPTVTLSDTDLSDITIDSPDDLTVEDPAPAEPAPEVQPSFSSGALRTAIGQVLAEAGAGTRATSVMLNDSQVQIVAMTGADSVKAYSALSTGEFATQDATISITGNATVKNFSFSLARVDAGAVDRMVSRARKLSGAPDFTPTVLRLERDLSAGLRPPEWTINGEGNGHYLTFRADANGRHVKNVGGEGTQIPQAAIDARKLNGCIKEANGDTDAIVACFDRF